MGYNASMDHFDRLPDSVLLVIFNKFGDIKALGRCCAVSKRFCSIALQVQNVVVKVDCVISSEETSGGSSIKNRGIWSHLMRFMAGGVFRPLQALQGFLGPKKSMVPEVSHHSPGEVLKSFKEVQNLRIELPGGELGIEDGVLQKPARNPRLEMSYMVQAPAFLDRRCFVRHVACIFPVGRMSRRCYSNAYYALARRGISCRVINGCRNNVAGSGITSWLPIDPVPQSDDAAYGGWSHGGIPIQTEKRKGNPFLIFIGGRKLLEICLAILVCSAFLKKGFKAHLNAPVALTHQLFKPLISRFTSLGPIKTFEQTTSVTEKVISSKLEDSNEREKDFDYSYSAANKVMPRNSENKDQRESNSEATETEVSHVSETKIWRIPAVIDSAQLEALSALQKLKIVESHIQPGELCTRREYARWLVSANSVFSRNPSDRVFPSVYIEGVTVLAFDDITPKDPDFPYIQGLAEAGVIHSKLSFNSLNCINDNTRQCHTWTMFYPENHLSRVDLLTWKMFAEHKHLPEVDSRTLEKKSGFLDAKQICVDAQSAIFMDTLAGNKSVTAKAFGYSRRFQPDKPVTKGQALIAITSGKVAAMVSEELSRVEAENLAKEAVIKEILSEMVTREEIKSFWDKELDQSKQQRIEAEKILDSALSELNKEKDKVKAKKPSFLTAEAFLEFELQYISKVKLVFFGMQKFFLADEQRIQIEEEEIQKFKKESQAEIEALSTEISLVEAETKALILSRLWVEDETRQIEAQGEILKEAVNRWKYTSSTCSCWCHQQDGTKEDMPEEGKSSHVSSHELLPCNKHGASNSFEQITVKSIGGFEDGAQDLQNVIFITLNKKAN